MERITERTLSTGAAWRRETGGGMEAPRRTGILLKRLF